jgi:hypothetical protein
VQQIQIEIVSAETNEACPGSTRHVISGHLIRLHFGDQEYAVTLASNHMAYQLLRASISVISRGKFA